MEVQDGPGGQMEVQDGPGGPSTLMGSAPGSS